MSNLFNSKIPVKVQRRNAFSQDFTNSFTAMCGTLTPCFVKQVMPGDKVKLGVNMNVELPPMAGNFKGKISANVEFFFVPWRIVYAGWKNYYLWNNGVATQYAPAGIPKNVLPTFSYPLLNLSKGSLLDYLGIRSAFDPSAVNSTRGEFSLLPLLAYHKIWEDWYRDPQVQKPAFMMPDNSSVTKVYSLPYTMLKSDTPFTGEDEVLFDGQEILEFRQRNYAKDLFTNAYTTPSGGISPMSVSTTGNSFTISQLRNANALQRFAERNQIAGGKYDEVTLLNYGVKPSDSALNEALYLGRLVTDVYNTSVYSTSQTDTSQSQNPWTDVVGGKAANSSAQGGATILKDFEAHEFGVVMGIFSLVPHAQYRDGIDPIMMLGVGGTGFADNFPIPAMAGVGNEAIPVSRVNGYVGGSGTFGYTDRYAEWKYSLDEVHGNLAKARGEVNSLSYLQLVRDLKGTNLQQSSAFLQIPTDALDNITAVSSAISDFGCIVDMFFNYTTIRPLPAYSIPSLCDDIDQAEIRTVERGGKHL